MCGAGVQHKGTLAKMPQIKLDENHALPPFKRYRDALLLRIGKADDRRTAGHLAALNGLRLLLRRCHLLGGQFIDQIGEKFLI